MRVLLVEDDRRVSSFVSRGLSDELHSVTTVETGLEGLEYALTNEFDVIILDLALPEMGGAEVCSNLRNKSIRTPILILSAMKGIDTKVDVLNRGADDYLTKPFVFDELLARTSALFRRQIGGVSNKGQELKVKDLVLDLGAMEAWRGNHRIELTKKEQSLLELLMSSPNQVFSRTRILSHIWGMDADPLTNIVDVYIGRLRKKVDAENAVQLIETVRGRGYRIRG